MCPIQAAAELVWWIRSYPNTNDDTPISALSSVDRIKNRTRHRGETSSVFKADAVGTHSLQSAAAMAMFLGGLPVYLIMLMGRWSSNPFLRYIRKQVEQISHNVSSKMIENVFHRYIPTLSTMTIRDPRQRNIPNNDSKTQRNVGGDVTCQARLPAFSLFI